MFCNVESIHIIKAKSKSSDKLHTQTGAPNNKNYSIIVRDYELYSVGSGMRFRGYFDNYETGESMASFNLVKVSDWTDWDRTRGAVGDSLNVGKGNAGTDGE